MDKHSPKEDWIAILTGAFLVAQGIFSSVRRVVDWWYHGLAAFAQSIHPAIFWHTLLYD